MKNTIRANERGMCGAVSKDREKASEKIKN